MMMNICVSIISIITSHTHPQHGVKQSCCLSIYGQNIEICGYSLRVNDINNWKKARERFGRRHLGEFHKDIRGRNFCFAKAWQFVDTRKRKEI